MIMALVVMAITFTVGAGFLAFSRSAYQIGQSAADADRAFYLTQSGLAIARYQLTAAFGTYPGTTGPPDINFGGGTIAIAVEPRDGQGRRRVTVTSTVRNVRQQAVKIYKTILTRVEACWVLSGTNLVKITADGKILVSQPLPSFSYAMAANAADGSAWVGDGDGVIKVAADGSVTQNTSFGAGTIAVNSTDGSAWAATYTAGRLGKFNPDTTLAFEKTGLGVALSAVAVDPSSGDCLLVLSTTLLQFDASGNQSPFTFTFGGTGAAARLNGLWFVADYRTGTVKGHAFDNAGTIWVNSYPGYLAALSISVDPGDRSLWIANYDDRRVIKVAAASGAPLASIAIPGNPDVVSVDPTTGSCWIGTDGEGSLLKVDRDGSNLTNVCGVRVNTGTYQGVHPLAATWAIVPQVVEDSL